MAISLTIVSIGLIALIAVVLQKWMARRDEIATALEAKQLAQSAYKAFLDLCEIARSMDNSTQEKIRIVARLTSDADLEPIEADLKLAQVSLSKVQDRVSRINEGTDTVEQNHFTDREYKQRAGYYGAAVRTVLDNVIPAFREVGKKIEELTSLAQRAQLEIDKTRGEIDRSRMTICAIEETGIWVAAAKGTIVNAQITLANAAHFAGAKTFAKMSTEIEKAKSLAADAVSLAKHAQDERVHLITWHLALQGRHQVIIDELDQAVGAFATISQMYEYERWHNVEDNIANAREALVRARNALDAAQIHFDLRSQKWEEAKKALETAQNEIELTLKLSNGVLTLQRDLDRTQVNPSAQLTTQRKEAP